MPKSIKSVIFLIKLLKNKRWTFFVDSYREISSQLLLLAHAHIFRLYIFVDVTLLFCRILCFQYFHVEGSGQYIKKLILISTSVEAISQKAKNNVMPLRVNFLHVTR